MPSRLAHLGEQYNFADVFGVTLAIVGALFAGLRGALTVAAAITTAGALFLVYTRRWQRLRPILTRPSLFLVGLAALLIIVQARLPKPAETFNNTVPIPPIPRFVGDIEPDWGEYKPVWTRVAREKGGIVYFDVKFQFFDGYGVEDFTVREDPSTDNTLALEAGGVISGARLCVAGEQDFEDDLVCEARDIIVEANPASDSALYYEHGYHKLIGYFAVTDVTEEHMFHRSIILRPVLVTEAFR